jgi:hypothetical protein
MVQRRPFSQALMAEFKVTSERPNIWLSMVIFDYL